MSEYIVAIDLGSSKIAGMVAQRNEQGLLKILAVETESSQGIKRGIVSNHSEAALCVKNIILKLQNRLKIEIGKVYVNLSGFTLHTEPISVPKIFDGEQELTAEIIKALKEEANYLRAEDLAIFELIEQDFILDGEPIVQPEGHTCKHVEARYLQVIGREGLNQRLCSCLERIPQQLCGMFTGPIAMAEALVGEQEKEMGCAVIDFGAETTSLVVYGDSIIRHMAVIPFGGKTITNDLRDLKITLADADKLKKLHGCALVSALEKPLTLMIKTPFMDEGEKHTVNTLEVAQMIEARMDEILDLVCMEIEKSGYMGQLRAGIFITGGTSQLQGLSELIQLKTGMSVRKASYKHLLEEGTPELYMQAIYAQLLGLLNLATEDCLLKEEQKVEPVAAPQNNEIKSKKKRGGIFSGFSNKLAESLFTERDFEDTKE